MEKYSFADALLFFSQRLIIREPRKKPIKWSILLSAVLLPQALIPLALEGTNLGKVKACHALAKIASISNPEMAFPGERVTTAQLVFLLDWIICSIRKISTLSKSRRGLFLCILFHTFPISSSSSSSASSSRDDRCTRWSGHWSLF